MFDTNFFIRKTASPISSALIVASGMCLFGLFAHCTLPLKALSISGLCLIFFALSNDLKKTPSLACLLGLDKLSKNVLTYTACGIIFGFALGIAYRFGYGIELWVSDIESFAPVAALIGATEEILYRGIIQGRLKGLGSLRAVILAAVFHTAYKCSLFALYSKPLEINVFFLAACTFVVGVLLGTLKERARSVAPPVAAHAFFDIMAYGEYSQAPWWVWS
jgi:membrane protease YdiL (CAAX protease family)